jgi:hypothetical protein
MPVVDPRTPQQAARTSSELLGAVISGLDRTLSGLHGLSSSPVAGGDQIRDSAIATFARIRSHAASAKVRIDTASNDTALRQAIGAAGVPLTEISKVDLLQGFDALPALADEGKRAPNCEPLTSEDISPHLTSTG